MKEFAHWLIADDRLELCNNIAYYELFIAYLKHSILYHKNLLVSDSQLLDNINLRKALQENNDIIELAKNKFIGIAKRDSIESLVEFKNNRLANLDPKTKINNELWSIYECNSDIELIESNSDIFSYSLQDLGSRYTINTIKQFKSIKNKFKEDVHKRLIEAINQEYEDKGGILRSFIHYDLVNKLPIELRNENLKNIQDIGTVHYITGLSNILNISPIYAREHSEIFKMYKSSKKDIILDKDEIYSFESKLNLDNYINGLKSLSSEDIMDLTQSADYRAYRDAINNLDYEVNNKEELKKSLNNYQFLIEKKIVDKHYGIADKKSDTKVNISTFLTSAGYISTLVSINFGHTLSAAQNILLGVASLMFSIPVSKNHNVELEEALEYQRKAKELKDSFEKDKNFIKNENIESSTIINKNSFKETEYINLTNV